MEIWRNDYELFVDCVRISLLKCTFDRYQKVQWLLFFCESNLSHCNALYICPKQCGWNGGSLYFRWTFFIDSATIMNIFPEIFLPQHLLPIQISKQMLDLCNIFGLALLLKKLPKNCKNCKIERRKGGGSDRFLKNRGSAICDCIYLYLWICISVFVFVYLGICVFKEEEEGG